jgi:hypothetical protein
LLLDLADTAFIVQLTVDVSLHGVDAAFAIFFDFKLGEALLLHDHLVLHFVVLLSFEIYLLSTLLKLDFDGFGLFGFLTLGEVDGFLDLTFLILTLLLEDVIVLRTHLLRFDVILQVNDFLEY